VRYIFVSQWLGSSEADFEALISMEDRVNSAVGRYATVDGHDFGSGEMNIFVETDQPAEAFADAAAALAECPRWEEVRAAYRDTTGAAYTVLWPHSLREFAVK